MKFRSGAIGKCLYALGLVLCVQQANSQVPAGNEQLLKKVSPSIVQALAVGTPQEAFVTFDDEQELAQLERKFRPLREANGASRGGQLTEAQENDLIAQKQIVFDQVKKRVFENGKHPRIKILKEFPATTTIKVFITDMDALLELAKDDKVQSISPPRQVKPMSAADLSFIGQPTVIALNKGGEGTRVAVVDDGLWSRNSADIAGKIVDAVEFDYSGFNNGRIVPLCSVYPCGPGITAHGQLVASIVGEVAPNAVISFVKTNAGPYTTLPDALAWVLSNYSRAPRIASVNISYAEAGAGGLIPTFSDIVSCQGYDAPVTKLISNITSLGIVVVVAGGNQSSTTGLSYPACLVNVVSVGSVADATQTYPNRCNSLNSNTIYPDQIDCTSNQSPNLTILAPGVNIMDSAGDVSSGTSFATFPRLQLDQAAGGGRSGIGAPKCQINPASCQ